ncbi:unnamed protein product [Effrenium voratum]|nr:unnamed protein product [Effrenium voratum]
MKAKRAGNCLWLAAAVVLVLEVGPSWLCPSPRSGHVPTPQAEISVEPAPAAQPRAAALALGVLLGLSALGPAFAYSALVESKIMAGGASTTGENSGSSKNITRGVDLSGADYSGKRLLGVSFQQSLVRDCKFVGTNLENSSFFDADLNQADFTGANMNQVNLELARLSGAKLDNAVATEMYVNGTTKMDVKSIEGADFTDTPFRADQVKYLCNIAKGVNPTTKVSTRESLACPD